MLGGKIRYTVEWELVSVVSAVSDADLVCAVCTDVVSVWSGSVVMICVVDVMCFVERRDGAFPDWTSTDVLRIGIGATWCYLDTCSSCWLGDAVVSVVC